MPSALVRAQVERLGGRFPAGADGWGSIAWPKRAVYDGPPDEDLPDLRSVDLGGPQLLEGYPLVPGHADVVIGIFQGGNYFLLVSTEDPDPTDPQVFYRDHDSFDDADAARCFDLPLSTFLSRLQPRRGRR